MTLADLLPLLASAAIMFTLDVFASLTTACIAHGRSTMAANFDSVGDVSGRYFMPIVAVSVSHDMIVFGAIATAIGGWLGTKTGVRLSIALEERLGRPVPHRLRGAEA